MGETYDIPNSASGKPDSQYLCLTICGYRRPGMSEEEYKHHMTKVSAPMTKGLMVKYGVKRWTMIHNSTKTRAFMAQLFDSHMVNLADFDCFSQVVFRSVDDYKRMKEDPWYKQQVAGDHVNFADTQKSMMTIGWISDFIQDGKLVGDIDELEAKEREHRLTVIPLWAGSTTVVQAIALITGSFLSGCMMSLSLMAVPVLLETTTKAPQLYHQWTRMYHHGHHILPALAVGTALLYTFTVIRRHMEEKTWGKFALAGVVTLSMVPFTWIFMVPTNNVLFQMYSLSRVGEPIGIGMSEIQEAKELIVKWSWMHLVRSFLPLVGAVIGTMATFTREYDIAKSKDD